MTNWVIKEYFFFFGLKSPFVVCFNVIIIVRNATFEHLFDVSTQYCSAHIMCCTSDYKVHVSKDLLSLGHML